MSEPHVVYENTVDEGKWAMKVVRAKPYVGSLIVTKVETGEEVYHQPVTLAYDAAFGPDMDDVAEWQAITINVIDKETS